MQYYAGLDVSMKSTNICVFDQNRKIHLETVVSTMPCDIDEALSPFKQKLKIVGIEAGGISFWLIDELKKRDLPACCLDAKKVAAVLSIKRNKTDKNDARGIAEILVSGHYSLVHERSPKSVETGALLSLRAGIIEDCTAKKNRLRGVLKSFGIRLSAPGKNTFIESVRNHLSELPEFAKKAIELALHDYEDAEKKRADLDELAKNLAQSNPETKLLQTAQGIGPITALAFVAEIDDPTRFAENPEKVGAYLGLTPTQYSSGETIKYGKISKAGSAYVRSLLYEAAIVLLTRTKSWSKLKSWGIRLSKRMPIKKAACAVARKLAVILLKMWLNGEVFNWGAPQKKENGNSIVSSTQHSPIVAKAPGSVKAKPFGLAARGLDLLPGALAN